MSDMVTYVYLVQKKKLMDTSLPVILTWRIHL